MPVPTRIQTVALQKGWNSVFLEVDPAQSDPAVVFAGTPIDVAAAYLQPVSTAQFISNPDADLLRKTGWSVWYSAERPDGFLTSLHAINGQQSYLLHATEAFEWRPAGAVLMPAVRWQADAFNLVGFSVSGRAPPTFAQFFDGSAAHRELRVYRLVAGVWEKLSDPSAQTMRSGEAFWIYCSGSSHYTGPVSVETPTGRGLVLGPRGGALVLRNRTTHPVAPAVEGHSSGAAGAPALPVSLVIRAVGDPRAPVRDIPVAKPVFGWVQPLPVLEAGEALRVPLAVQREAMTAYVQTSLLRVATDVGTETWVPVFGVREDLKSN